MDELLTSLKDNIWLILFVIWGLPLSYYRGKFRKIVYRTDSWIIYKYKACFY